MISSALDQQFDVVVIGGGIHGAWLSLLATKKGYKVLLLERNDFAFGTSGASSNIAHGGVRYLLDWDVKLVYSALKERAIMYKVAPHLVRQQEFVFALKPGADNYLLTRLGLFAYSALSKIPNFFNSLPSFPWSRKVRRAEESFKKLQHTGLKFRKLISYWDGQYLGSRLVTELIQEARRHGAVTLNYANAYDFKKHENGKWQVSWTIDGMACCSTASYVANLTGPWAEPVMKQLGHLSDSNPYELYLSRGVHLVFNRPWNMPAVIRSTYSREKKEDGRYEEMGSKNRYYFVLPYFTPGGELQTLVGTTDDHTVEAPESPVANEDEIEEIFSFLWRDFPELKFSRDSLSGSYCGIRPLAKKKGRSSSNATGVSRAERFIFRHNAGTMLGGKYTNARDSALRMLRDILTRLEPTREPVLNELSLPGAGIAPLEISAREEYFERTIQQVAEILKTRFSEDYLKSDLLRAAKLCVDRFGLQAMNIAIDVDSDLATRQFVDQGFLDAEVRHAIVAEQAATVDDVIRRLCLEFKSDIDLEKAKQAISLVFRKLEDPD